MSNRDLIYICGCGGDMHNNQRQMLYECSKCGESITRDEIWKLRNKEAPIPEGGGGGCRDISESEKRRQKESSVLDSIWAFVRRHKKLPKDFDKRMSSIS